MAQSRLRIYRVWVSIASPACNHLYIYIGSLHLPFVQDEQGTLLESDLVDTNAPVESFLAGIAGDSAGNVPPMLLTRAKWNLATPLGY